MSTTINQVGVPQTPVETGVKKVQEPVQNLPSFRAKTEIDKFVKTYEVEATKDKKWGVGLASASCPGLGQAINGQWGKGLACFLGTAASIAGLRTIRQKDITDALAGKSLPKSRAWIKLALTLGGIGLYIATIVDAVKKAKSTVSVVDEKGLTEAGK